LPKVERKEMVTLSPSQSRRLLDAIAHTRVYWPVLLALATGMRRGEILALRWKRVDLEHGSLQVMESLEQTRSDGLRFKSPKTDRTRVVTLPGFATKELRRLKREQAKELLMLGIRQSGETLVCGPYRRRAPATAELDPPVHAVDVAHTELARGALS
jgi:integrase